MAVSFLAICLHLTILSSSNRMLKNCKTAPLDSARGEELSLFFIVSEVEPSSLQRKNEFFSILLKYTRGELSVDFASLAVYKFCTEN